MRITEIKKLQCQQNFRRLFRLLYFLDCKSILFLPKTCLTYFLGRVKITVTDHLCSCWLLCLLTVVADRYDFLVVRKFINFRNNLRVMLFCRRNSPDTWRGHVRKGHRVQRLTKVGVRYCQYYYCRR